MVSAEYEESQMIEDIEKEIEERSKNAKRGIRDLFNNAKRELKNGEYGINPSKPIYEQDPETYKKVLTHIMQTGDIKISEIVNSFGISYIKAVLFVEDFKKHNYVKLNNDTAKYDTITEKEFIEIFL